MIQTYQFKAEVKVIKKRSPDERTSLTRLFERICDHENRQLSEKFSTGN